MDPDALLATIRTNTAAPALISQVVLPSLERGRAKKILHITSTGGSIGSVDSDRMQDQYRKVTSYAMSKTALNMLVSPSAFRVWGIYADCDRVGCWCRRISRRWSVRTLL